MEVGRQVGRADTGESVQWGVVQWRLPEVLDELQKEQGDMQEMSGAWTVCLLVCVCTQQ